MAEPIGGAASPAGRLRRLAGLVGRHAAGLPALARRHLFFTVLLSLGFALRVIVMIAYRPAIFYIDSVASYLLPLPHMDPTGQDPIGYDLYLLGPVTWVANLATVAAVQHLLGLGIAVTGYALLLRKGAPRWLAALSMAPVLLDAYQLWIEHSLMTEALFESLLLAALAALAWRPRPGWGVALAAGLMIGMAATVRQAGELVIAPAVGYVLLAGGAWRRRLVTSAVAVAAFLVPVAGYASFYDYSTGHFAISGVTGNSLYGRVATFADCSDVYIPANERVLCPGMPPSQRPGPDFWMHDATSPYFVLQKQVGNSAAGRLSKDFSTRIIRHQPVDFARSVTFDAVKVFQWNRTHQFASDPPVDRWQFPASGFPLYLPLISNQEISMYSHRYGDGNPATVAPLTTFLRWYQLHVGYTPGPAVALALLLALAPLVRWRRAGPARLPALLFLAGGALVLLTGDVVVFSWRYQLPGYVLLPIAGALGLTALINRRRPAPVPPTPAGGDGADAAGPAGDLDWARVARIEPVSGLERSGPVLDPAPGAPLLDPAPGAPLLDPERS